MRVMKILQDLFGACRAHVDLRLLHTLFASVEALSRSRQLTIAGIGRSLKRNCFVKNKIKTIDRLFGNTRLQDKISHFYHNIILKIISPYSKPIIIVDWSNLTHCGKYQFLRAAVPVKGRALPIFEMVFEEKNYNNNGSHKLFLTKLKEILPEGCQPIIVTDAGFRSPWFKLISSLKWHYIGRVRHTSLCCKKDENKWNSIRALYKKATNIPQYIGQYLLTKNEKLKTNFYLYKSNKKNRAAKNIKGKKRKDAVSLKQAKSHRDPWLLVTSLPSNLYEALKIINIYKKRMQIEESFKDLKNERTGLRLRQCRSKQIGRLAVALLIGAITLILLWILGLAMKNNNLHYRYQANTITHRDVLSNFIIGWQALEEKKVKITIYEVNQAITILRETSCA